MYFATLKILKEGAMKAEDKKDLVLQPSTSQDPAVRMSPSETSLQLPDQAETVRGKAAPDLSWLTDQTPVGSNFSQSEPILNAPATRSQTRTNKNEENPNNDYIRINENEDQRLSQHFHPKVHLKFDNIMVEFSGLFDRVDCFQRPIR